MNRGSICHFEIPAIDIEKTRDFYSLLFNWQSIGAMENYQLFVTPGKQEGGFANYWKPSEPGIIFFIEVDDIEETLPEIEKQGGKITMQKTFISKEHGYFALFMDVSGNTFGLWSREEKTVSGEKGKICWMSLPSTNSALLAEFYSLHFNWKIETDEAIKSITFETESGQGGMFDEESKTGVNGPVFYLEIEDVKEILEKVEKNGARIIQEKTRISDEYGYSGLFEDPQGNLVGLWSKK